MATYKDLQDRINLDYLNRMTMIPEVKRAIINTIRTYEPQRYWFNEAQTAIAASAGQSFISLPADFLALDRLEITQSSASTQLYERTFSEVRNQNYTNSTGFPSDFAYRGDRIELGSIPNSAYSINVYYIKSLATLSADADSNAWTNEAQNLIAHAATIELLSGVLQADNGAINKHMRALKSAENELEYRNSIRLVTRLKSTYF